MNTHIHNVDEYSNDALNKLFTLFLQALLLEFALDLKTNKKK